MTDERRKDLNLQHDKMRVTVEQIGPMLESIADFFYEAGLPFMFTNADGKTPYFHCDFGDYSLVRRDNGSSCLKYEPFRGSEAELSEWEMVEEYGSDDPEDYRDYSMELDPREFNAGDEEMIDDKGNKWMIRADAVELVRDRYKWLHEIPKEN